MVLPLKPTQDPTDELFTLRDCIRWSASRFAEAGLCFGHGTDNAFDEAFALALPALGLPFDLDPEWLDARLTRTERQGLVDLTLRRVRERKPLAYLSGRAWFAGLEFVVDERVLVPRSPIAELIANGFEPWLPRPPARILDLCTGSGCIAIACALAFPEAQVDAVELSGDALAVARLNRGRHGLDDQLELLQGDLFAPCAGRRYDLIVSNPPYVHPQEYADLPAEFRAEPRIGLEADDEGLAVVNRILAEAAAYLSADGVLVVEVGSSALALTERWPELPFTWVEFEHGGDGVFVLQRAQLPATEESV